MGIGVGVGVGAGVALLALLGFLLWRRRKSRVGDDFKWPELGVPGESTGSNGTAAAGLYPNPTHPTNNRFDMDDEELFDDGDATTNGGHLGNGTSSGGGPMMSEREPSFLSSAAGSAGYPGGGAGYPGQGGGSMGGAAAAAGGLGAGALAASQGSRHGHHPSEYYNSQDGHYSPERSPPPSAYTHQSYGVPPQQNGTGYPGEYQQHPSTGGYAGYDYGLPAGAAAGAGGAAGGVGLGRTGSIASTAQNYQVEAIPNYGAEHGGYPASEAGDARPRNRNRLSVVNNLGDVGEE